MSRKALLYISSIMFDSVALRMLPPSDPTINKFLFSKDISIANPPTGRICPSFFLTKLKPLMGF